MKLLLMMILVSILMGSCGANYTYYVLNRPDNKLMGTDPYKDLPLDKTCDPDSTDHAKCIVMLREEFFKAKKETLELRAALKACQKGNPPSQ